MINKQHADNLSRPLRIGINALFRGKPTGVANYLINLVNCLQQVDHTNRYVILIAENTRDYFQTHNPNFKLYPLPVNVENPTARRLWEQKNLPALVREKQLDILHSPVNILPILAKCRHIVTFIDCQYFYPEVQNTFSRRLFHKVFMRLSHKRARMILTISNSMKEEIIKYFGKNGPEIQATPLGQKFSELQIDHYSKLQVNKDFGITPPFILFVGFPHFRKNLPGLLRGFAQVLQRLPQTYQLVFCGDIDTKIESDYQKIVDIIQEKDLSSYVKFIGYQNDSDLKKLLKCADLFAFPSFYEGFGLPALEAMACGTPLLVSDIPVMRELADSIATFCNPYDVDDIAEKIYLALTDSAIKENAVKRGPEVAAQYTWTQTAFKTLTCYRQIGGSIIT